MLDADFGRWSRLSAATGTNEKDEMKDKKVHGRIGAIWGAVALLIGGCLIALAVEIGTAAHWIVSVIFALFGAARSGAAILFQLMQAAYPQIRVTEDELLAMFGSFGGGVIDLAGSLMLFAGDGARPILLLTGAVMLAAGILVWTRSQKKAGGGSATGLRVAGAYCLIGVLNVLSAVLCEGFGLGQMLGILLAAGGLFTLMISLYRMHPEKRAEIEI